MHIKIIYAIAKIIYYAIMCRMIKDFNNWNELQFSKGFDPELILREGNSGYIESGKYKKDIKFFGGDVYHIKEPHSRHHKIYRDDFGRGDSKRDNRLATATELLSEMRYRELGIPYAYYELFSGFGGELKLMSKDILTSEIDIKPLVELFYCDDESLMKSSRRFVIQNLEEIITDPKIALKIMTPECYDQFIKYSLASIFDFANDEHFNNIIFIKNKKSPLFESMFLCDKESNLFNPFLAREYSLLDVIEKITKFDAYYGFSVYDSDENFDQRVTGLLKMVLKGTMPKKYVKFLSDLAGFDFEKASNELKNRHGISLDERQIDVYKWSTEIAGKIAQKGE